MKEKIKITITLTDDDIALYGENTQDLTEDDIIDIFKMLGSLAKTSSILQEGDPRCKCPDCGCCCDYGSPCCELKGANIDHPGGCKKL